MVEPRSHMRQRAQPAHAADRFAREILAILECDTSRSRRLMRHSFGGNNSICRTITLHSEEEAVSLYIINIPPEFDWHIAPPIFFTQMQHRWPNATFSEGQPISQPASFAATWLLEFTQSNYGSYDPCLEVTLAQDGRTLSLAGNFALCVAFVLWYRQQIPETYTLHFTDTLDARSLSIIHETSMHMIYSYFDPHLTPEAYHVLRWFYDHNEFGVYTELVTQLQIPHPHYTRADFDATLVPLIREGMIGIRGAQWDWQQPHHDSLVADDAFLAAQLQKSPMLVLTERGERAVIVMQQIKP